MCLHTVGIGISTRSLEIHLIARDGPGGTVSQKALNFIDLAVWSPRRSFFPVSLSTLTAV